jgi:hypothetical protein
LHLCDYPAGVFLAVAALVLNVLIMRWRQQRVVIGTKALGYTTDGQVVLHLVQFGRGRPGWRAGGLPAGLLVAGDVAAVPAKFFPISTMGSILISM